MTTNSRGVKSSLTRMTLCRRGRSTFTSSLILGLVMVSVMADRFHGARIVFERMGDHREMIRPKQHTVLARPL